MSTIGYNTPSLVSYKLCFDQSPATESDNTDITHVRYVYLLWCVVDQTLHKHSEHMLNPGRDHRVAVQWILHYLKVTTSIAICYSRQNINLVGYKDVDFVEDHDKRMSTTRYVFNLAGGANSWMSKFQFVVALSTTEAEYMSATHAY